MAFESGLGSNLNQRPKLPKQFKPLVPQNKPLTSPSLPVRLSDPAKYGGEDVAIAPVNIGGANLTPSQLYSIAHGTPTAMSVDQVIARLPDVDPQALRDVVSHGTRYIIDTGDTGKSRYENKNVILAGLDAYKWQGVLGHESVHAWEDRNKFANPIVGATTMLNLASVTGAVVGAGAVQWGYGTSQGAALRDRAMSRLDERSYGTPYTSEWLASYYMTAQGNMPSPSRARSSALRGFLK